MTYRKIGLLLLFMLLLGGCGFSSSKEDAGKIMDQYFAAIQEQDYPAAMAFCAEAFFQDASREVRQARLKGYHRQFGDLQSFEAVSWNVKKKMGTNAGTFVQVVYRTRYSRPPALERFVLKEVAAGFRIIAHRVEAGGGPKGKTEFI